MSRRGFAAIIAAAGSGGGGAGSVILPTPSFGSTSLLGWWDKSKTWTDELGGIQPGILTDPVGGNTVAALIDLTGNGFTWIQDDKALQPTLGPDGGPLFDVTSAFMRNLRPSLFNGLSKLSVYLLARPIAGTAKRTFFSASEASSTVMPSAVAIATGGTGYQIGDYVTFTGNTVCQVNAVSAGVVTGLAIVYPKLASPPLNPVSQTAISNPAGGAVGTGLTVNFTYPAIGSGSNIERMALYSASGSTTRKQYHTMSVWDGTGHSTATTAGTSWGAANGGALTDTTTYHRIGHEIDLTGASASAQFYYDGAADGAATVWTPAEAAPWTVNTADSAKIYLGNNLATTANMLGELKAMIIFSDVLDSTRRAQVDAYLAGL